MPRIIIWHPKIYETITSESTTGTGFFLNKDASINDVINIKWLSIEEQIEYSLAVMRFKAIYDENDPNSLKLTQKVASTRNLRSNNKGALINANSNRKRLKNKLGI